MKEVMGILVNAIKCRKKVRKNSLFSWQFRDRPVQVGAISVLMSIFKLKMCISLWGICVLRPTKIIKCYRFPPFFHDFHTPTIFFMILAQIHALYDADRSAASIRVSSSLFVCTFRVSILNDHWAHRRIFKIYNFSLFCRKSADLRFLPVDREISL